MALKFKLGQAVLELLINQYFNYFDNLKTAWPTKISMPVLSSL